MRIAKRSTEHHFRCFVYLGFKDEQCSKQNGSHVKTFRQIKEEKKWKLTKEVFRVSPRYDAPSFYYYLVII